MEKKTPRGIDSFEEVREMGYYYVDKSMMIKELLCPLPDKVVLITRPRRFGKSLNLSMLECFLNIEREEEGTSLFDGLSTMDEKEVCDKYMHKYPILHISFKEVSSDSSKPSPDNYNSALENLKSSIWNLAMRHRYLLKSDELDEFDKEEFHRLIAKTSLEELAKDKEIHIYDGFFNSEGFIEKAVGVF